jgi:hypothetical protein
MSFKPVNRRASERSKQDTAAAELEIEIGGSSGRLWLQRNQPELQSGTIDTRDGPLRVQFTSAEAPLGFALELMDFQGETNGSRSALASHSSQVRIIDPRRGTDEQRLISLAQPLSHNGFRFYQTRTEAGGHGKQMSTLRVVYDPGRTLKRMGSWAICLGIATMYLTRANRGPSFAKG